MGLINRRRVGVGLVVAFGAVVAFVALGPGRPVPPGFVSIRKAPSFQDAALLEKAWALPVAAKYPRPLISQSNPSACGPTSVANVLRSTGVEATSDQVAAHGVGCFAGICTMGLTLGELASAATASAPGWTITTLHPSSVEALREELRHANEEDRRYVINLHRFPLFGAGGGHHSPLGGYLEAEDLVFVLDVNASYGPWLVSTSRLYEAMDTTDDSSGEKRGLLKLQR